MATVKPLGEGGPSLPEPPTQQFDLSAVIQCPGALLSGRRERGVAIERVGFSALRMRIATSLNPGSWVELRVGPPYPEGTRLGGVVQHCEPESSGAGGGGPEFSVEVELHAVPETFLETTAAVLTKQEDGRELTIAFSDIDPLGRTALGSALRGLGRLLEVTDRAHIARTFSATPPDILLLPTRLPDADAIALVRSLFERGWRVPTLLLSTQSRVDAPRAAKELTGATHRVLEKPVGREKLRAEIGELLAAARAAHVRAAREQAQADLYRRLRETHGWLRRAAGSYLGERVLAQGAPTEGKRSESTREITVLFVDIRNSTTMIDRLDPNDAVKIINRVLTELAEAVETHGGLIDKFLGDGLMALFGAVGEDPYHQHRALSAARTMVNRVRSLNQEILLPEGFEIGVGIGIQSGSCILGNVGSEYRKEFTALGAPVNVAARIQSLAAAHQIVLPAVVAKGLEDVARFESLGRHALKGFEKPVEVVRVLD